MSTGPDRRRYGNSRIGGRARVQFGDKQLTKYISIRNLYVALPKDNARTKLAPGSAERQRRKGFSAQIRRNGGARNTSVETVDRTNLSATESFLEKLDVISSAKSSSLLPVITRESKLGLEIQRWIAKFLSLSKVQGDNLDLNTLAAMPATTDTALVTHNNDLGACGQSHLDSVQDLPMIFVFVISYILGGSKRVPRELSTEPSIGTPHIHAYNWSVQVYIDEMPSNRPVIKPPYSGRCVWPAQAIFG